MCRKSQFLASTMLAGVLLGVAANAAAVNSREEPEFAFGPVFELSSLDGSNGFRILGERSNDANGLSVASAGDVNADGFDDVIIGSPRADPNGDRSGASYVVFGKASGFGDSLDLSKLDGSAGFEIQGEAVFDHASLVSGAGDVNGDGFADLIVGAPYADANGSDSGASYVVFGKAEAFAATLDLSALDGSSGFKIRGEAANDRSGARVSGAGDVNGDGFGDVIIGARLADPSGASSGASYVVFGKAGGFPRILDLSSLDGNTGLQLNGETAA